MECTVLVIFASNIWSVSASCRVTNCSELATRRMYCSSTINQFRIPHKSLACQVKQKYDVTNRIMFCILPSDKEAHILFYWSLSRPQSIYSISKINSTTQNCLNDKSTPLMLAQDFFEHTWTSPTTLLVCLMSYHSKNLWSWLTSSTLLWKTVELRVPLGAHSMI